MTYDIEKMTHDLWARAGDTGHKVLSTNITYRLDERFSSEAIWQAWVLMEVRDLPFCGTGNTPTEAVEAAMKLVREIPSPRIEALRGVVVSLDAAREHVIPEPVKGPMDTLRQALKVELEE